MTRLEDFTLEIAGELVDGLAVADVTLEDKERAGVSGEEWDGFQQLRIDCTAAGIEAALRLLAAAGSGRDQHELARLTNRLAVGYARLLRERDRQLQDALGQLRRRGGS
jgi:hypothetical protein